jgi:putative ABC transport system permease protein
LAQPLPFSGSEQTVSLRPAGEPEPIEVGLTETTAAYFEVLGIELLRGRVFDSRDAGPAPTVALVNRSLAQRLGGGDVLGSRVRIGEVGPTLDVIGVVADVRHAGLGRPPDPRLYLPYRGRPDESLSVVIRTQGDPAALVRPGAEALAAVEPTLAVERLVPMRRLVRESAGRPRFHAALLGTLAAIAGLLTAVGIYGLTSFTVAERIPELGIRRALGARGRQIIATAMGREVAIASLGVAAGAAGALVLGRVLRGLLYGVEPGDPRALALAAVAVLALSALATLVPALRAVRSDPVAALRDE